MGDLHAVVQRDKGIPGAGQAGVDAVAAQMLRTFLAIANTMLLSSRYGR